MSHVVCRILSSSEVKCCYLIKKPFFDEFLRKKALFRAGWCSLSAESFDANLILTRGVGRDFLDLLRDTLSGSSMSNVFIPNPWGRRGEISSNMVPRVLSPNILVYGAIGSSKLGRPTNETGVLGLGFISE